VTAKAKEGSGSTSLKFGINIPQNFDFDFEIPGDRDNGLYFNAIAEYDLVIHNKGNTGDKILIETVSSDTKGEWNVTLQGETIGPEGYNVSVAEFTYRNLTLSVQAPNSTEGKLNDRLTLDFTVSSLFYPQQGEQRVSLSFQVRRANLMIEDVRIINGDLKKDKNNITVNVTVKCENTEVAPTEGKSLVKLYYKDKELDSKTVDLLEEDSTIYVEFKVDARDKEMVNKTCRLKVVLDEDGEIPETNENDNTWTKKVAIGQTGWNFPWAAFLVGIALVIIGTIALIWWRRRSIYT
jgi:hypothetical protein